MGACSSSQRPASVPEPAPISKSPSAKTVKSDAPTLSAKDPTLTQKEERVVALRGIINNDSMRRALLKFLQAKNLEMFLDFYFEIEELGKMSEDQINVQAEVLRDRYRTVEPGLEQDAAREQWNIILHTFETDFKALCDTATSTMLPRAQVMELFRALQNNILGYLSTFLDPFLESPAYQDMLNSERQRERESFARKIPSADLGEISLSMKTEFNTLPSKYKHVLVVDDSKIATKIAASALIKNGHIALTANHGRGAIEELARQKCQLLLIDLYMPIMDGFETVALLRGEPIDISRTPSEQGILSSASMDANDHPNASTRSMTTRRPSRPPIPSMCKEGRMIIVGMSSDTDADTIRKAVAVGVDHFMSKPFSIEKLAAIIQEIEAPTNGAVPPQAKHVSFKLEEETAADVTAQESPPLSQKQAELPLSSSPNENIDCNADGNKLAGLVK